MSRELAMPVAVFTTFSPLCLEGLGDRLAALGRGFATSKASIADVKVTIKARSLVNTKKYNFYTDGKIKELKNFW